VLAMIIQKVPSFEKKIFLNANTLLLIYSSNKEGINMNTIQVSGPVSGPVFSSNSITLNIDTTRRSSHYYKNSCNLIIFHYFYFLLYFARSFLDLFYFFLDHPDFTKSFGSFLLFLSTNFFLFYDFLSPYLKNFLYFVPDTVIDFINNFISDLLYLPYAIFGFILNILVGLKLTLRDFLVIFFYFIENSWVCFKFTLSKICF
jgi:hypothetical protein